MWGYWIFFVKFYSIVRDDSHAFILRDCLKLLRISGIFFNKSSLFSRFHDIMRIRWIMFIDYSKLWKKLAAMGIKNKTDLIPLAGISSNILAKLSKGDYISMESLQKICKALHCDVGDICVVNDENSEEK